MEEVKLQKNKINNLNGIANELVTVFLYVALMFAVTILIMG